MKGLLCPLLGHKYEYEWVEKFSPALGRAEVQIKECQRCGFRVPTGRDRPL